MFMNKIVPDYTINQGSIRFSINTKMYPAGSAIEKGPYTINNATQKIDFRARGRQANIRVSTSDTGTSWKWGSVRLGLQPDGTR